MATKFYACPTCGATVSSDTVPAEPGTTWVDVHQAWHDEQDDAGGIHVDEWPEPAPQAPRGSL